MIVRNLVLAGAIALAGLAAGYWLGAGARPDADLSKLATEEPAAQSAAAPPAANSERKILYYRNPMGLADTSPVPKKDWMGMDYIVVYEGEEADDGNTVKVSLDRVQRAGVRTATAEVRQLARPVQAVGKVMIDERTLRAVTLKTEGFVQKLYVKVIGETISAGEPLFRLFSPEILKAQAAYRAAMIAAAGKHDASVAGARQRLVNLDVPNKHIQSIGSKGEMPMAVEWPSPVGGTVIETMVVEGERAEAGRILYRIADLSRVWIVAEVNEQDLGSVRRGAKAKVTLRAMPAETITAAVDFIYPQLDAQTRTGKVRLELSNDKGQLKPEMYADVVIETDNAARLSVPAEAIIEDGTTTVVLIEKGEGRFEPRAVKLGIRGDGYVEITDGLAAGEKIVVGANFLIDAESNLKAALKSFTSEKAPKADDPSGGSVATEPKP